MGGPCPRQSMWDACCVTPPPVLHRLPPQDLLLGSCGQVRQTLPRAQSPEPLQVPAELGSHPDPLDGGPATQLYPFQVLRGVTTADPGLTVSFGSRAGKSSHGLGIGGGQGVRGQTWMGGGDGGSTALG